MTNKKLNKKIGGILDMMTKDFYWGFVASAISQDVRMKIHSAPVHIAARDLAQAHRSHLRSITRS